MPGVDLPHLFGGSTRLFPEEFLPQAVRPQYVFVYYRFYERDTMTLLMACAIRAADENPLGW
jgi:hypothetical protein